MLGGGAQTGTISKKNNKKTRKPGPGPWRELGLYTVDMAVSWTMHVCLSGPPSLEDLLGITDNVDPR
eukprot:3412616-Amphidinium_carterae.1